MPIVLVGDRQINPGFPVTQSKRKIQFNITFSKLYTLVKDCHSQELMTINLGSQTFSYQGFWRLSRKSQESINCSRIFLRLEIASKKGRRPVSD